MKLINDNLVIYSQFTALSIYAINEHAQNRDLPFGDPYFTLSNNTKEILINHASTGFGSMAGATFVMLVISSSNANASRKTKNAFAAASLATGLNGYKEYTDIEYNNQSNIDYGDLTAIALGISCFAAIMFNHIRKSKKHERSLSL